MAMTKNEICGAVLGTMVIGMVPSPMVCGKPKGHPDGEGHTPAVPTIPTSVPSEVMLKALGANIARPTAPTAEKNSPNRPPGFRSRIDKPAAKQKK